MDSNLFEQTLIENPIVAAIRNDEDLNMVIKSRAAIVFILYGSIINIGDISTKLRDAGKIVFVHVDMIDGLRGDIAGIEFIKKYANPFGMITTKPSNIKHVKQLGLYTIQRIFTIDSLSLKTGVKSALETGTDAVEVMPGIAPKIIGLMQKEISVPIIAGGLIDSKKDIMEALSAGALAISTTARNLWNL
jgi:glycerol uptake operon antiterminator